MNPLQRKKVDLSKMVNADDAYSMTPEEKKKFELYGSVPKGQNLLLSKLQKDRKYFDSGDYALSKAGKTPTATLGTAIPQPESIPHHTPSPVGGGAPISPTSAGVSSSPPRDTPLKQDSSMDVTSNLTTAPVAPAAPPAVPTEKPTDTTANTSATTTSEPTSNSSSNSASTPYTTTTQA